jgi:hypothetical protein
LHLAQVFGGWFVDFCNDLVVLDTTLLTWLVQPVSGAMPQARAAHSATLVDSHHLFIFGGESQEGRLDDVWVLDTTTMHWTEAVTTGTPPSSRSGAASTTAMSPGVINMGSVMRKRKSLVTELPRGNTTAQNHDNTERQHLCVGKCVKVCDSVACLID